MDQAVLNALDKLRKQGHAPNKKIETETYVSFHCPRCGRYMVAELDPDVKKWVFSGALPKSKCAGGLK